MANYHKIRAVAEKTGFPPNLLRAWERRYDLLEPVRQEGGHRLYTDADVRLLNRVRGLLEEGRTIGEVAALGRAALLEEAPGSPARLAILRPDRYQGEGLAIELRELANADLVVVLRLYEVLKRTYELYMYLGEGTADHLLSGRLSLLNEPDLSDGLARLGAATRGRSPLLRAALEHTRWGAVSALSAYSRELARRALAPAELRTAILLARDHAKMMRNAFLDLDAPLREADEAPRAHKLSSLLAKFSRVRWGVAIQVYNTYTVAISARCLETSALDRLFYDLVRRLLESRQRTAELHVNACGPELLQFRLAVPEPGLVPYGDEDFAALVVGLAVGLEPRAALQRGYLGGSGRELSFCWPLYLPPGDVPVCDCD